MGKLVTENAMEAESPVLGHVCAAAQADILLPDYVMGDEEKASLRDAWAGVAPPAVGDLFAHQDMALRCAVAIPSALVQKIQAFAKNPGTNGVLMLRNFPHDSPWGDERDSFYAEAGALAVAGLLGDLCKNVDKRGGAVMQHLRPVREDADKQLGTCCCELYWHTEDAHLWENCHFIVLYCLRGDLNATTFVSRVEPDELPMETRTLLEAADYGILPDESYDQNALGLRKAAVLSEDCARLVVRFDPVYVQYPSQAHRQALMTLNNHLNSRAKAACLTPGDVIVIDNRIAVHARSAFKPRFNGKDRWLLRVAARS